MKDDLFHYSTWISLLLVTLIVLRPDLAVCAVPTLDWSDAYGLWHDGVNPDYGISSTDTFVFQVSYQDADNNPPQAGYPQVHIKRGGVDISGSPFALTEVDSGDTNYRDGKLYSYSTSLGSAGSDYAYYFVAHDCTNALAYGSPAHPHTLTVVSGYVWVDYDAGNDTTGNGSEGNPYKTITKGVGSASAGQAVRVRPRTSSPYYYQESFSMVSGVHLVSDNSDGGDSEAVYDDPYSSYTTSMLTRTGRTIINGVITFPETLTADVALDGFTVYLAAGGPTVLDIYGKSPIIRNNIVYWENAGGRSCLQMEATGGTNEPVIENNLLHRVGERAISISANMSPLIQDNEIWGARTYPGIGINRKGVAGGVITILNNHIFNCGGPGIGSVALVKGLTVTIQGNSIHDNGFDTSGEPDQPRGAGINLKRCCIPFDTLEVTIGGPEPGQGNEIYNNRLAGIRLDGDNLSFNPVLIQNNTIHDNDKTGILLIDAGYYYVPPGPNPVPTLTVAAIKDNTIYGHTNGAGINIGGATYADIRYNSINNNYAGIAFNMAGEDIVDPDPASSGTLAIEENDIYSNTLAGIVVKDAITGAVTIAGNDIYQNDRGGIGIVNSCNLVINRNNIHDNIRAGIHTGTEVANDIFNDTVGFIGPEDSALLTVTQNKVYRNGLNSYGGGVDIRHASGSIANNLIYKNQRGGIRFGDYIDKIVNNTVVDNGYVSIENKRIGGGIIYDDLGGAVNDPPAGGPSGPIPTIRNNITAFNILAGIRDGLCSASTYRDYNLIYRNHYLGPFPPDFQPPQLSGCSKNAHEIYADPLFVDRGNADYRLQAQSPAVDAGDPAYGDDAGLPPGVGTAAIDMGAFGGPDGIDW